MKKRSGLPVDALNEDRVMSMLRCLQHPNIMELHAAFCRGNELSLLMPLAECDLSKILKGVKSIPGLTSDMELISALWRLASGLRAVHEYHFESSNERRIGCHYDIKPANILCMDGRLVLSDFGLSRLHEEEHGSQTTFQDIDGDYVAPECLTCEVNDEKQRVGRPSDVWSLGCVLCEILVFMTGPRSQGPQRVEKFWQDRRVECQGSIKRIWRRFHDGQNLNRFVKEMLSGYDDSNASHPKHLNQLASVVGRTLVVDTKQRIKAGDIKSSLYFTALKMRYEQLNLEGIRDLNDARNHFNLLVESHRLAIWAEEMAFKNDSSCSSWTYEKEDQVELTMERIASVLQNIQDLLKEKKIFSNDLCWHLRRLVDELWLKEDASARQRLQGLLIEAILETTSKCSLESTLGVEGDERKPEEYQYFFELSMARSIIRRFNTVHGTGTEDPMPISAVGVPYKHFNLHHLTTLQETGEPVLIESIEYDRQWESRVEELIKRVQQISQLRHKMSPARPIRVLKSLGYLHDPTQHHFGIVYQFPAGLGQDPTSLHTIIAKTKSRAQRPSLTQKFALASALVSHVLDLHRITWLHKSLCSSNIIFFPDTGISSNSKEFMPHLFNKLSKPYFIGFDLARLNSDTAFSRGPQESETLKHFQHPAYLRALNLDSTAISNIEAPERYRQEFDYYSTGMILLEIAYWLPINEITKKIKGSPEDVRKELLNSYMGTVSSYMGDTYAEVVRWCLDCYVVEKGQDDLGSMRKEFQRVVVDRMDLCLGL